MGSYLYLDYFLYRQKLGYLVEKLYGDGQRAINYPAIICWLLGAMSGLLVTNTGFIDGPLAKGIFADSSLGLFISFLVSFICYYFINKMRKTA